jgi:hypothetical protein
MCRSRVSSGCFHPCLLEVANIDAAFFSGDRQLSMVVTEDFKLPTEFNASPLLSISTGRGSVTFFNPGTVMAPLSTGQRVINTPGAKGKGKAASLYPGLANAVFPEVV